jgi:prophage regulatory protein
LAKTRNSPVVGAAVPALRRFLRLQQVREVTGLPESSVYALMATGKFPKAFKLSANRVAWLEDDVAQWQAERLAGREVSVAS